MVNNKEGLSLAEFSPAEAQLTELANKAKLVDISNIAAVHDARIDLRDARIALTKKGRELRDGALVFQKSVISKEKDLLAIIVPEEERLDIIESEYKLKLEIEKRRNELPTRVAALSAIGVVASDSQILALNDNQFNEWRFKLIEEKLIADKQRIELEQRETDRIAREKLDAERIAFEAKKKIDEDRIRVENDKANELRRIEESKLAAERAEVAKEKARLDGIEQERQRNENAKLAKDKAEMELARTKILALAAEQATIEAEKGYQEWLKSIGYNPVTDMLDTVANVVTAYRKMGTYKHNK